MTDRYRLYQELRKKELEELRKDRRQEVFAAVLNATTIKQAAEDLGLHTSVLCEQLLKIGVKHEHGERWRDAVKDYLDAGEPHQYEMPVSSLWEYIDPAERGYSTPLQK